MLSRSRLHRRWHRLNELSLTLFELLGPGWKYLNTESIYMIDSFPRAVCDHDRIPRAKLDQQEKYRGHIASKKRYVSGLKVHLLVTKDGQPVECLLTPGSYRDVRALKNFQFDGPEGSWSYADRADNDEAMEDVLLEAAHVQLCPIRKKLSKLDFVQF